jgi:hypothetical protein
MDLVADATYGWVAKFVHTLENGVKSKPGKWELFVKHTPKHKIVLRVVQPSEWSSVAKGSPIIPEMHIKRNLQFNCYLKINRW